MKRAMLWMCAAAPLLAQPVVAPTAERVGRIRGSDFHNYNIVQSWELGYRFRSVDGNAGKYRSDVNFGNGVRLLAGAFAMYSKDGRGRYFDELVANTQGLGNDPYQSVIFRLRKNRLYRYDFRWWLNDFFNPALTIARGLHAHNTERRFQDHDFTLFPDSNFRLFLGYTRNVQDGPALSTVALFDSRGDEFPLFTDVRRQRNEFRFGGETRVFGFRLNAFYGLDNFREDSLYTIPAPQAGANPGDANRLDAFRRAEPYHGNSPYWRVGIFREGERLYAVNGRFTYTAGQRDFVLDETAIGTARFGAAANRQILTFGNARRPVATGNLNVALLPGSRFTITNHTAFHNIRMEGDAAYRELDNATLSFETLRFQYLGIRTFSNSTDFNARLSPRFGLFGGYHYANRLIGSVQDVQVPGFPAPRPPRSEQTNQLHSGIFGVRLKPAKPFTIQFDGEIGRADRPIQPTSERNYHALGARADYRGRTLRLSALVRTNYNFNSVQLSAFSSRSRQYAADASWTPKPWFALDSGYSKLHLDTAGGIAYFLSFQLTEGERSLFFSNIHSGHLTARLSWRRADFQAGYTRVQDTGDGRGTPFRSIGSALPLFQAAQTFPLSFESPQARLSIRLHERLRVNAGYQYYRYTEEFSANQNYRAHTGFTSLLWSF
ncbi:MAG: hypothetical protein K2X35_08255 [Bryobacteraceae bacterium]|nr:hypothetical protein [Bryobacteraceae bacterium]